MLKPKYIFEVNNIVMDFFNEFYNQNSGTKKSSSFYWKT
jgi:hypothetical protein